MDALKVAVRVRPLLPSLKEGSPSAVRLNCWFCSEDSIVPQEEKNGWTCSTCEQFNGFKQDGDYSQPLPNQYDVKNYKTKTFCVPDDFNSTKILLCERCSQNQVIKVRQLAAFVPLDEARYNEEIDEYKDYIENVYNICNDCQQKVTEYLETQNAILKGAISKESELRLLDLLQRHEKDDAHDYSVEKEHHICKPVFQFVIFCLSSVAAFMFFICNLRLYAGLLTSGSTITKLSYLRQGLSWLVTTIPAPLAMRGEILCAFVGAALCIVALSVAGKYSLYPEDAVYLVVWVISIIFTSDIFFLSFPWLHLTREISLCVSAVAVLVSIVCCVRSRHPRHFTATTIQKKSFTISNKSCQVEVSDEDQSSDNREESSLSSPASLKLTLSRQQDSPPYLEDLRQDLESVSLGLSKKSDSSSSIWSLPAIITPVIPDSSSDHSGQHSRSVLSPSRLGYLSFDSQPPSRDSQSDSSHSPFPWASDTNIRNNLSQASIQQRRHTSIRQAMGECVHGPAKQAVNNILSSVRSHDHSSSVHSLPPKKLLSPTQGMEVSSSSENSFDSHTLDQSQQRPRGFWNRHFSSGAAPESHWMTQNSRVHENLMYREHHETIPELVPVKKKHYSFYDSDISNEKKGPRRSLRIAMAGKVSKPWPLKKSLSFNNMYDQTNLEKAVRMCKNTLTAGSRRTDEERIHAHKGPGLSHSESMLKASNGHKSESINVSHRKSQSSLNATKWNDKHRKILSEFSDDEGDNEADYWGWKRSRRDRTPVKEHKNDFSWKWILIGLTIGTSVTTNIFLAMHHWPAQPGSVAR